MKKIYLFPILALYLVSCSNELKKNILEPLSEEVLESESNKDTTFKDFYENIRLLTDSVFVPKGEFTKYKDLQYYSFWELEKASRKRYQELEIDENINTEWINLFGKDIKKFQEDSIKYFNHIKENYYKNFVEFEPIEVYRKKDWISFNTYVTLKVIPKNNNTIRRIMGDVYFLPKITEYDTLSSLLLPSRKSAFFTYNGNSKNDFSINARNTSNELIDVIDLPIEIIKQKYNIEFYLSELVISDKYIDVGFEKVPYSMKRYYSSLSSFDKEYYINEEINKSYKSKRNYISDLINSELKPVYKLEYDFYEKGWKEYFDN